MAPADEPDPLDVDLCDMIEREVSREKAEWARRLLRVRPTPGLVLTPGLWLRGPKDPPNRIRIEVVAVGRTLCRVLRMGDDEEVNMDTSTLLRFRETIVPKSVPPSWLHPGVHVIDHCSATRFTDRWIVRTVKESFFTARHHISGVATSWDTEDDYYRVAPLRTAWERLDDDMV